MQYAEIRLLYGFLREYFVFTILSTAFSINVKKSTIFIVCFLYGVITAFCPIFPRIFKTILIVVSVVLIVVICSHCDIKVKFLSLLVQLFFTYDVHFLFILVGLLFLLSVRNMPIILSRAKNYYYPCEIIFGEERIKTVAFYDSGNRFMSSFGEPIVMADKRIYNRLVGKEEEVFFSTITGPGCTRCKEGVVVVFVRGKEYKYKCKIAMSPQKLHGFGLLLHGDMKGGIVC